MNHIKSLRIFGTIYLWIFVVKVLQVCGSVDYHHTTGADTAGAIDGHRNRGALIMKPTYTYQIFDDDYTDELLNSRNVVATPMWHQTLNKQQIYYKGLPMLENFSKNNGNSMTSGEITFENLNDFDSYKIKNAIWPKILLNKQHQQQKAKVNRNDLKQQQELQQQQRHRLQQFLWRQQQLQQHQPTDEQEEELENKQPSISLTTIKRYQQHDFQPIPIIIENRNFKTKDKRTLNIKTSSTTNLAKTKAPKSTASEDAREEGEQEEVKEHLFPLKEDDNTLNVNDNENDDDVNSQDETNDADSVLNDESNESVRVVDKNIGIANSNGNGNENVNYADNNLQNTNYNMMMAKMAQRTNDNDHNRDDKQQFTRMTAKKHLIRKGVTRAYNKRAKPSVGHTPFLPAVSGGAMTNLGKFFRDLSKNVHVSEQYQWNAEEQKLLEGDPNFSNIHHHLSKPNAATDQQTAEWIKAIRFYRPSQKIRSLVAMNPHGQWDHSSQFIDPNYMWVGLGK